MRRRVLTMDEAALRQAVERLEALVASTGYAPDTILSIRRGGEYVGTLMFTGANHISTTLQRPGTKRKDRWLSRVLKYVPRKILDRIRIFEAWWLSKSRHKPVNPNFVELPDISGCEKLLIVDDAVDSGVTLQAVKQAVKQLRPDADVLTAVITVTTRKPLTLPDFSLYNDLTLIRFPWSLDK